MKTSVHQAEDGGSTPTPSLQPFLVQETDRQTAADFVRQHHYSKVMPRLTKWVLGAYRDDKLIAVITFGWGVRPLHTIKTLFACVDGDSGVRT